MSLPRIKRKIFHPLLVAFCVGGCIWHFQRGVIKDHVHHPSEKNVYRKFEKKAVCDERNVTWRPITRFSTITQESTNSQHADNETHELDLPRYRICMKNFVESRINNDISHRLTEVMHEYSSHPYITEQLMVKDGECPSRLNKKIEELGKTVQAQLYKLQNPRNCSTARKLLCTLNPHGFGSALHHVAYCLMFAYSTQRTVILDARPSACGEETWHKYIRPLSDTCHQAFTHDAISSGEYFEFHEKAQTLKLNAAGPKSKFPKFIAPIIPSEILRELTCLPGDVNAWWIGQFMVYALRLQPLMEAHINSKTKWMGFTSPTIGMHIRRTDKIQKRHKPIDIQEYMRHVIEFTGTPTNSATETQIYLATDDASVIAQIKEQYPEYKIISDTNIAQTAELTSRKSDDSLRGIIQDLFFLSQSDFLVCTFSSNICRAAYEIMQSRRINASSHVRSLDCEHFFMILFQLPRIAVCNHDPGRDSDIGFKRGDLLLTLGNLYNGFSIGRNLNSSSKQFGIYPSHMARSIVVPYFKNKNNKTFL